MPSHRPRRTFGTASTCWPSPYPGTTTTRSCPGPPFSTPQKLSPESTTKNLSAPPGHDSSPSCMHCDRSTGRLSAPRSTSALRMSWQRRLEPPVPTEKVQHRIREDVVAITGNHVSRAADIDELDLRKARQEFVGTLLADQIAHLASHQQHGHAASEDRFNRRVQPIDRGPPGGRQR